MTFKSFINFSLLRFPQHKIPIILSIFAFCLNFKFFLNDEKKFLIKMYSLVIPPEYLRDLVEIRKRTKTSIRKQILNAITDHIAKNGKKKHNI